MNKFQPTQKRQQGLTLLELLLALTVVAIVLAIGIIVFGQVQGSGRAYGASQGLINLSSSVKAMHPRPNYTGITSATVVTAGKAPKNMINGANIIGDWGGNVTLAAANYNGGTNNAFTISYPNVPKAECNDVVNQTAETFAVVRVGATVAAAVAVKNLEATPPVEPTASAVATACDRPSNVLVVTAT